jgi:hypothetical protein
MLPAFSTLKSWAKHQGPARRRIGPVVSLPGSRATKSSGGTRENQHPRKRFESPHAITRNNLLFRRRLAHVVFACVCRNGFGASYDLKFRHKQTHIRRPGRDRLPPWLLLTQRPVPDTRDFSQRAGERRGTACKRRPTCRGRVSRFRSVKRRPLHAVTSNTAQRA